MENHVFFVYVLINPSRSTYLGQTEDLQRRVAERNDPESRRTLHTKRIAGPWRLLHFEVFPSRAEAMKRERELKTGKGRDWIRKKILEKSI